MDMDMDNILPLYMSNQLTLEQAISSSEPHPKKEILLSALQTSKSLPLTPATQPVLPPDLPSASQEKLLELLRCLFSPSPPPLPLPLPSTGTGRTGTTTRTGVLIPDIDIDEPTIPIPTRSSTLPQLSPPDQEEQEEYNLLRTEILSSAPGRGTGNREWYKPGCTKPWYNLLSFVAFLSKERLICAGVGEEIAVEMVGGALEPPPSPSPFLSAFSSHHHHQDQGQGQEQRRYSHTDSKSEPQPQSQPTTGNREQEEKGGEELEGEKRKRRWSFRGLQGHHHYHLYPHLLSHSRSRSHEEKERRKTRSTDSNEDLEEEEESHRLTTSLTAASLWLIIMGEELWERKGEERTSPLGAHFHPHSHSHSHTLSASASETGPKIGEKKISRSRWEMWRGRLQFLSLREDLDISARELAAEAAAVMGRV